MAALVREFDHLPRGGHTIDGFAVGIYPTDHPTLPDQDTCTQRVPATTIFI